MGAYQEASGQGKVIFTGTRLLDYRLALPDTCLYRKNFLVQPEGRLIHRSVSETGIEGIPYLWAYGGQQVGDDIHPFVFTMEALRHETFAQTSSLLYWRQQGIYPAGEEGVFQDAFEEDQTRTLCESIEAGMSLIHLDVGLDEKGQVLRVPYRSFRLSKNFIFYKKEEM